VRSARNWYPTWFVDGHEVVAVTTAESKQDVVEVLGARPVVADAHDPDAVDRVVGDVEP
jgi:D-arabinose 1-dehydrogenase-like Zn-dependent alcohol dehydrogenase